MCVSGTYNTCSSLLLVSKQGCRGIKRTSIKIKKNAGKKIERRKKKKLG
jgi:hypothetical protein